MPGPDRRLKLLIGPFNDPGTARYMVGAFDDFSALTFGSWAGADLPTVGLPTFAQVVAALPEHWQPDMILLWRPEYGAIPEGIENAACPVAMLVSDWYLAFSDCLEAAWRVDAVVTGSRGYGVFRASGFEHVLALPMLGYQPGVDNAWPLDAVNRPIDVCCSGNPHWIIHRERERVVGALAALPAGVRVFHGPFADRAEYNRRLGAARIFVNQTVIGEANMKFYEVAAAGACLFVEEGNLDVRDYFIPGESVVLYRLSDLAEKVAYYLEHEAERIAIAAKARSAMAACSYRHHFRAIVEALWQRFAAGPRGPRPITELGDVAQREGLVGYALRHNGGDPLAPVRMSAGLAEAGGARSLLLAAMARYIARTSGAGDATGGDEEILAGFATAFRADPTYLPAAYTWGRIAAAHLDVATALAINTHVRRLLLSGCAVPFSCADHLALDTDVRFEVERAAWEAVEQGANVDEALRPMLLEDVLLVAAELMMKSGDAGGALASLAEAVHIRPDGHRARPRLARLRARSGDLPAAVGTLREHLSRRPLDLGAHDDLVAVLEDLGDGDGLAVATVARAGVRRLFVSSAD
jgi:hypothetical protein